MAKKSILFHLLLMFLVGVVSFFLLSWGLDYYTRHNQKVIVPELRGMHINKAIEALKRIDLRYEVVDSIYDKKAKPNTVVELYPSVGNSVKPQRIIFIKIYSNSAPKISIPYLKDMSSRQAYALLRALGFESVTQKLVSGEYKGLSQGVTLENGKELKPGERISRETPLILLITGEILSDSLAVDDLLLKDLDLPDSGNVGNEQENDPEDWW